MTYVQRSMLTSIATAGVLCSGAALASGFAIIEQSVKGLGAAFSNTAGAEDASTVFFNPAGLTRLDGTQVQAAGHVVAPSATFEDQGSTLNPALDPFAPVFGFATGPGSLTGGNAGDSGVTGLIPNLYVHHAIGGILGDRLHFGFGANAPFALKTNYEEGWPGRYHALTSELKTFNFNPSLAYEATSWLSFGAGFNAQYIEARLTNALDQSTACIGAVSGVGSAAGLADAALARFVAAGCGALALTTPGSTATDAKLDLRNARDWSLGWNVGALWHFNQDQTRVGVHYRSKISHQLEGTAQFDDVNAGLLALSLADPSSTDLMQQRASAKITLPESASVHLYHAFDDHWAVHGDVSWTRWSRLQKVVVAFADDTESTLVLDWDNSLRYSGGLTYSHDSRWTLRAGGAFDETPTPDPQRRSARIPDEDRTWVTVGASYQLSDQLSIDAGYAHLFVDTPNIGNTESTTGNTLVGEYDADADIGSVQVVYHF